MDCNRDQYSNCPRQGWVCLTLSAASSERRADEKNDYQGKDKVFEKEEDEISIIDCRRRWNYLVNHVGQPVKEYGKQCSLKHVDSEPSTVISDTRGCRFHRTIAKIMPPRESNSIGERRAKKNRR